jgi:hypothetical protein
VDDHQILQTRQLKARLESIATAGEILRVSLGATTLADAVRTLLLGLFEIFPAGVLSLFEVHEGSLVELGRLVEGEQAQGPASRILTYDEPAMVCISQHRHILVESSPSLIGPASVAAVFLPFEGRLGELTGDGAHLRASHLLWVESPDHPPSPEELDTLIALASQAGVLLTGFRYRDDLERTYSALREANKRLQKDIDRARKIQEGLLPQATPVVPGHWIDWKYLPAEKVSGDYFDCFPLDPKDPASHHCVVIAGRFRPRNFRIDGHGHVQSPASSRDETQARYFRNPGDPQPHDPCPSGRAPFRDGFPGPDRSNVAFGRVEFRRALSTAAAAEGWPRRRARG